MKHTTKKGFTLVEVLVTISVIGVLGAITVAAVGSAKDSAYKATDVAAARQLVTAYLTYPQDHGGKLMPAIPSEQDVQYQAVYDHQGNPILNQTAASRYVFRLLPYVDGMGAFYPGRSVEHLDELIADNDVYGISISPAFGLNEDFVGGNFARGRYNQETFPVAVTTLAQSFNPSEQIVFVSSLYAMGDDAATDAPFTGFYRVAAPNGLKNSWTGSTYNEDSPATLGNIHLRHNGLATVAHLDGSVALLTVEELKDMRRWSYQAQRENNENFSARSR